MGKSVSFPNHPTLSGAMLCESEFNQWCDRLNLSEECREIITTIRTSEPVRKVKGSGRNVSGISSSQKVGRTIQFESHTVELPALISFYEYDDDVLEYWDQPFQLTLKCSPDGKKATNISHIPDFFVLRTHSFGFEEWKLEKALIKRAEKYPYRYIRDEDGKWQDVPAREQVEQLGFYFRLRTDSEIDWVRYRNLKYLKDYLDKSYPVTEEVEESLNTIVTTQPGISLTQLLQKAQIATIDEINALIATNKLYVDLSAVSLTEQERVHIFRDQVTAEAYVTATLNYSQPVTSSLQTVDIKVGSSFLLDGKCLTIDHIGDSKVILRGQDGLIRWTHEEFQQLVKLGDITNLQIEESASLDSVSRRILAVYITFDPPSYRSCMMILRICVQRFGRFPEWIVVDNGKEFSSTYFDTLIARFGANKKHRPKDLPKFSSIIERWFRTQNTQFLYNLRGNTQIMKHVRLAKKENNPKNLAVWELDELYDYFAFGYCYGVYDQKEHPALEGFSPQQAFEFGLAKTGYRSHQTIKYDDQFKILTSPSTQKGTAKVISGTGVRINYSHYWSDDFYTVENQSVPIRYDPLDYGIAYAYVGNRWVKCISNYYAKFQGYSERSVKLATTILRRKRQLHNQSTYINANEIVYLLEHAEEHEELMLQLRRDRSAQRVHSLIEGKLDTTPLYSANNSSSLLQIDKASEPKSIELAEDEPDLTDITVENRRSYEDEELW